MGCCSSQPVDFDSEVNLFHFELHRAVGKGAFGKVSCRNTPDTTPYPLHQVRVIEHKKTKQVYALKYIDKSKCVKQKAVANIIQERHLLEEVRRHTVLLSLLSCSFITGRPSFRGESPICLSRR